MVLQKRMERRFLSLCQWFGVPADAVLARCQRELRRPRRRHATLSLAWRSFFVGSRVVLTVTPYRRFRREDKCLHRHFNWSEIYWHKFNGAKLPIAEYVRKRQERRVARKLARKKSKRRRVKSTGIKADKANDEDSSDEVQLIEERLVISIDSEDEQECVQIVAEPQQVSFPKIVSVKSAGTLVDAVASVVTPSRAADEELKPTSDELERARHIFASADATDDQESDKKHAHSALYSLDDSFTESEGAKSLNQSNDRTFLDSLAHKLGVEKADEEAKQSRVERAFDDCYQELEKSILKIHQVASKFDGVVKDEDTSSGTDEFYGFSESDISTPGLLPTPLVRQAGSNAAFISGKCDKMLQKLGPINVEDRREAPRQWTADEERINRHSQPPRLECPEIPQDMKSKTLAEKKELLRMKPVGYQVLDQENSVYHLLKKRMKEPVNDKLYETAKRIMRQPVPMRRKIWQTATWLNTRQDHYIYRYITHAGRELKLFGCVGNFRKKHCYNLDTPLPPRNYTPRRKLPCCRKSGYPKRMKFNNILNQSLEETTRVDTEGASAPLSSLHNCSSSQLSPVKRKWNLIETRRIPPGPLCTKPKNVEKNENLAPLETFVLPRIHLQVTPQLNQRFPPKVTKYLNVLCPSERLTDEWIGYALCALKNASDGGKMVEFEIPYENDRRKILVSREVNLSGARRERTTEVFDDSEALTFAGACPEDECAQALADMIDSVAIGRSEDAFTKFDPDLDYSRRESRKRSLDATDKDDCPNFKKPRSKNSLLYELKRLNATIINTESISSKQKCSNEHCKLGCLCDSISSLSYPIGHCEKVQCMFECVCRKGLVINNTAVNPFSKEVFRMRDKAISRLARAEKDFSSTVVLTNNNTFLLSNSSEEKSKRNRVAPRKFGDYVSCEVEEGETSPRPVVDTDTLVKFPQVKSARRERAMRLEPDLERMRHTSVVLDRIDGAVDALEPWCMIHELYRCFCKCEATHGKPFLLKQISETCFAMSEELVAKPSIYRASSSKAKILFEPEATRTRDIAFMSSSGSSKPFEPPNAKAALTPEAEHLANCIAQTDEPEDAMITQYIRSLHKGYKVPERVYNRGELTAALLRGTVSRCLAFDKTTQVLLNKQNAPRVKKFISAMEKTPKILSLLTQRYLQSVCKSKKSLQIEQAPHIVIESNSDKDDSLPPPPKFADPPAETSVAAAEVSADAEDAQTAWQQSESRSVAETVVPVISSVTSLHATETSDSQPAVNEEEVRKPLLDKMNMCVSRMMNIIAKNEEKRNLDVPQVNKITTIRWINLLKEFRNVGLHILELHYPQKTFVVISKTRELSKMPPGCTNVCDLRMARKSPTTQFGRMINLGYNLPMIDNVAALLFGHQDYWQVMGFMHKSWQPQESAKYLSVTHSTHPEVAVKISKLYSILLAQVTPSRNSPAASNVRLMTQDEVRRARMMKFALPRPKDQRWFMLMITNDFSDISHPRWGQLLSYDRIRHAIVMARKAGRTVEVTSNAPSLNPRVYVAPDHGDRIFIGPYNLTEECNIVLYQRMDGAILLRETYEKMTNIQRTTSSVGCWIQSKECAPDAAAAAHPIHETPATVKEVRNDAVIVLSPTKSQNDDDDCVLVEADPSEIKAAQEAHEAAEAVNSILPDGLKLPTEQPKTQLSAQQQQEEEQERPSEATAVESDVENVKRPKVRRQYRKRKADDDEHPQLNIRDLTITPVNDNEDASRWPILNATPSTLTILPIEEPPAPSPPEPALPALPVITMVTSGHRESPPPMPVISKVVSLRDVEKETVQQQQSLLKSNAKPPPREKEETEKTAKLTPYENEFAQYLESNPGYLPSLQFINQMLTQQSSKSGAEKCPEVSKKATESADPPKTHAAAPLPALVVSDAVKNARKPKNLPDAVKSPAIVRSSLPVAKTEAGSALATPSGGGVKVFTTTGKKMIIHPLSMKKPADAAPPSACQKRTTSPPPLVILEKRQKLDTDEAPEKPQDPPATEAPAVMLKPNITIKNRVTIGQTVLQRISVPSVASSSGTEKASTVVTTSTAGAKSVPAIICNGLGNQMMKVRVNFTPPSTPSTSTASGPPPPKNTPKVIRSPLKILPKPGPSSSSAASSLSSTAPIMLTLPDGKQTLTFTRTTADGKETKYVLPFTKLPNTKIKFIPASPKVVASVEPSEPKKIVEKTVFRIKVPPDPERRSDVIELSDEEEAAAAAAAAVEEKQAGNFAEELCKNMSKEKMVSGVIVSNIPQLGHIKARMTDDLYYHLQLPTRRHPFKVGQNCLDRYMDRYMKYCVVTYVPQDLSVRWEFIEQSKVSEVGRKFSLEATKNKDHLVLTQYGVIDMDEKIPEEIEKDTFTFVRLLLLRLSYICGGAIKPTQGLEVIDKAIAVLAELHQVELGHYDEMRELKEAHRALKEKLKALGGEELTSDEAEGTVLGE
ncbi:uncharacterized protein LOC132256345 [Phlebotomus argentipes]|uniref:uncharacterized protein LOC132256345 n=1 Tax=Phlebotomus argentipes TaxID=94469 RepID=UPI0028933044|nr:uncharacterized protein LOC132256345 [Phlebotomus argentipes]